MKDEKEPSTFGSSVHPSSSTYFPFATDSWVRFLLAPALVFIACGIDRNYQTDLWHHLARGKVICEEGQLLDEDRFTYTVQGQPLRDVNWLSQVIFYRIWSIGGLPLLQTFNALLLAGTMALLVLLSRARSGSMLVAGGVGLFVFVGLWQFILIRPQTFSFLLFVLLYFLLEQSEKRPWLLRFVPLVQSLWVNLHGAFPIGLVLIGVYLFARVLEKVWQSGLGVIGDRRSWQLTLCLAASGLTTLANPYGWHVLEYVGQTSGLATARKIDEWLPPGLGTLAGKVWAASLVGMLILLSLPGRRPALREVCLLAVFLPLSCGSVRMVAWWLFIAAPIAAALIADRVPKHRLDSQESERPSIGAAVVCVLLVAGMVMCTPWFERWNPIHRFARSPHRVEYDLKEMADRMKEEATGGRVFTRFEWSEYIGWVLGPDYPIFMDGRIEIIPDPVWKEYSAVTSGAAEWQDILKQYNVEFLIIDAGPYHGRLRP